MSTKKPGYTASVSRKFRMEGWPNGIPAVYDSAGNLVCICTEDHGVAFAEGIALALNSQTKYLEKAA
jgi:hypothetical protein